jgi:hypothetical protein
MGLTLRTNSQLASVSPLPMKRWVAANPVIPKCLSLSIQKARATEGWKARRWVAEASHSWFNRNRGVLVRWSKKEENHLAFLQLAGGLIAFKKAHAARLGAVY